MTRFFSIITICRNEEARIQKTLESVSRQSEQDFEWIVIDGASTDRTLEIIGNYKSRIDILRSEPDQGIFYAQNKGLRLASGKYLLFLNGGDYFYESTALATIRRELANRDVDIVYGDMIINDMKGCMTYGHSPSHINFEHMMVSTLWHPVSFVHRRVFADLNGFNEHFKMVADYDFFFRYFVRGKANVLHVPIPVSVFHLDGLTSQKSRMKEQLIERRRVHEDNLTPIILSFYDRQTEMRSDPIALAKALAQSFRLALAKLPWARRFKNTVSFFLGRRLGVQK